MNLYAFVKNQSSNSIDILGLKKCTSLINAGHAGEAQDYLDNLRENGHLDPGCGNTIGFVSCFPGTTNQDLADLLGEDHVIPGLPNHNDFIWPIPESTEDRRAAIDDLEEAIAAAVADARSKCNKQPDCCTTVCVKVRCSPDMRNYLNRIGRGNICDQERCEECSDQ